MYVVCDDCARESLALFVRHPDPEPRRHSQPDGDPEGGDAFVAGAYQELTREYLEDAAVPADVQPPDPESPDMASADDAEECETGQRALLDPLRELRRQRAETQASLNSARQKFGDLDRGAG